MMSGDVLESFFVALGFKADTKGLEELRQHADGAKTALLSIVGVATGAATAIGMLVFKVSGAMAEMNDFAEINEVSAASVDALGKAAAQNNSSLDAVKASIAGVNKVTGEAALGLGRGAMTFQKLGMSARDAAGKVKSADDMLEEVADKINGLSRREQIATLEKLGIDRSMVMMLKDGSAEFRRIKSEAMGNALFTDEDYARADEINKLFIKVRASVGGFTKQIAVGLFPVVQGVLKGYLEWFKASKKVTADTFITAIKVLASMIGFLWDWTVRVAGGFRDLITWLMQFKIVTYAAIAALAIFIGLQTYNGMTNMIASLRLAATAMWSFARAATAGAMATIIIPAIIGLVILAVAALIDELVNFREGNQSFLGDLVKDYPQLGAIIQNIADGVGAVLTFLGQLFDRIKPALADLGAAFINLMNALGPVIKLLWDAFTIVASVLLPILIGVATVFVQIFAGIVTTIVGVMSGAVSVIAAGLNIIAKIFTMVFGGIRDFVASVFNFIFAFVDGFIERLSTVMKWIGGLLGIKGVSASVTASGAAGGMGQGGADGASSGPPSSFAPSGAIGVAANPVNNSERSSSVQSHTKIEAPITIQTNDPKAAADAISDRLDKMNRDSIRNSQSAVKL